MGPAALARVALGDPERALRALPAAPGVGQLLGEGGRHLLTAPASNLRRWAATHLGLLKPRPPATAGGRARRPRTNLAGIATAIAWAQADGPFRQRLLYERLLAPHVPPAARRDLRPPLFLHLDPAERFPRLTARGVGDGPLFGPFRDRRAAEKARDALQRRFALRPCELAFEPDAALPLGLACLYAQVRSCAAPCLARVSEPDYRAIAAKACAWLADPAVRSEAPAAISPIVAAVSARAVIVDAGRRSVGLVPLRCGRVLDAAAIEADPDGLEAAVARLGWPDPDPAAADDWPWLTSWLASPKRRATLVIVPEAAAREALVRLVRAALPPTFGGGVAGGNVGAAREDA